MRKQEESSLPSLLVIIDQKFDFTIFGDVYRITLHTSQSPAQNYFRPSGIPAIWILQKEVKKKYIQDESKWVSDGFTWNQSFIDGRQGYHFFDHLVIVIVPKAMEADVALASPM